MSNEKETLFSHLQFYIFSPIDKKIPPLLDDDEKIKIAIIHESIEGSTYYNQINNSSSSHRLKLCDLQAFDLVLLGDIHKPQFLTPKIAYSGSFV